MTVPASSTAASKMRRGDPPPRIPGLFDSHCHLDYPPAQDNILGCLARGEAVGVEQFMHIGCSVNRIDPAVAIARTHPQVYAAIGIHPHDASDLTDEVLARITTYARDPKVVAIGETGLDYHYNRSPRDIQRSAMTQQIMLAKDLDMPLVLHIRDAHEDAFAILAQTPPRENPGVVHCFTGTLAESKRWLDLGWHISFSGIVTFKTAKALREAATECPEDRILLETDAPFLAPEPNRGRPNEPANVAFTCVQLASLRGQSPESLASAAATNTRQLFKIEAPALQSSSPNEIAAASGPVLIGP